MLLEYDDLPLHQAPQSLAHAMGGHPDAYDRFWFNGYRDDLFFALALGIYPNRGVIDAAFSTVHEGEQRSVFSSARLVGRTTKVGPIEIEIIEPMRRIAIRVHAPEQGIEADLVFEARTPAVEEPRQTRYTGTRILIDTTRATQLGTWSGRLVTAGTSIDVGASPTYGTKDRSWGVRRLADPPGGSPEFMALQLCFLWSPINFEDCALHWLVNEDEHGRPWSESGVVLPLLAASDSPVDPSGIEHLESTTCDIEFEPGLRRARHARLELQRDGRSERIELEPLLTFRMRGAGYLHPDYPHGRYHSDLMVAGEVHRCEDLDTTALDCTHVQQVVRATWGDRRGIGVLEQLIIGPHGPRGLRGLTDGA